MFPFRKFPPLTDGEIELRAQEQQEGDPACGWMPTYTFGIVLAGTRTRVGAIELRIGYTWDLVRYNGHIGYGVAESHRGHHYAAKACRLIHPVAMAHGMDVLWITCNPDNWPSRKTCEYLGATLVEIVDLPPPSDQPLETPRQKCRYRWVIY